MERVARAQRHRHNAEQDILTMTAALADHDQPERDHRTKIHNIKHSLDVYKRQFINCPNDFPERLTQFTPFRGKRKRQDQMSSAQFALQGTALLLSQSFSNR